jgi:hypothetical protein
MEAGGHRQVADVMRQRVDDQMTRRSELRTEGAKRLKGRSA